MEGKVAVQDITISHVRFFAALGGGRRAGR